MQRGFSLDKVERVATILNYLASSREPCGVTEISKALKISKSSVCRILSSLERLKWIAQSQDSKYALGDNALDFSLSILSSIDMRNISLPHLYELNSVTNETAGLTLRVGLEDICIEQIESKNPVRHVLPLGGRFPLWSGATGKAMLAYMDESEVDEVLDDLRRSGVSVLASGQEIDINKLLYELTEVKNAGFAISIGERTPVTGAVASPIIDRNNKVVGSVLVTGPLPRFDADMARSYANSVKRAGINISMRLGSNYWS